LHENFGDKSEVKQVKGEIDANFNLQVPKEDGFSFKNLLNYEHANGQYGKMYLQI